MRRRNGEGMLGRTGQHLLGTSQSCEHLTNQQELNEFDKRLKLSQVLVERHCSLRVVLSYTGRREM